MIEIPEDFFITSDTWFGRKEIIKIANRNDFKTVEEMNASLVRRWNKKVKKDI